MNPWLAVSVYVVVGLVCGRVAYAWFERWDYDPAGDNPVFGALAAIFWPVVLVFAVGGGVFLALMWVFSTPIWRRR